MFFQSNQDIIKPYALMDLDDTLFQTLRKIKAWHLAPDLQNMQENLLCAGVDKNLRPLSFMTKKQAAFFNWLHASTELIAVTARDHDEIARVKLPFDSWQVLTHGALIIAPDGRILSSWHQKIHAVLSPLQDKFNQLIMAIDTLNSTYQGQLKISRHHQSLDAIVQRTRNTHSSIYTTTHKTTYKTTNPTSNHTTPKLFLTDNTNPLIIYLAVKHQKKNHNELAEFAHNFPSVIASQIPDFMDDFYIHCNANNMAILPKSVHKRHAVQFLFDHYLDNERPSFGFGDSLADLPFLRLLDWYGTPNHGQLHDKIKSVF